MCKECYDVDLRSNEGVEVGEMATGRLANVGLSKVI